VNYCVSTTSLQIQTSSSANFCKQCPDCTLYGYAIGDAGAEKSKVYSDSCFSITPYSTSHKAFSFNGLYEHGTMTDKGETRSSFGEQDHVIPQVFFPSVITLRDPTYFSFLYILGNLLRTSHYGAQETRTGKMYNHLLALVWSNGEIFSNLRFTQVIYDLLIERGQYREREPLDPFDVQDTARIAYKALIEEEPISRLAEFTAPELDDLRKEVTAIYSNQEATQELLTLLDVSTKTYSNMYGVNAKK
jgi:CRISPR-associated protein Csc2